MKEKIKKIEIKDFVYYEINCLRCDKLIRAHSEKQMEINLGMHQMTCEEK